MAEINVSVNVDDAIKRLGDIGRQMPFVASLELTAQVKRSRQKKSMKSATCSTGLRHTFSVRFS